MSLRLIFRNEWQCLPIVMRLVSETPPQPAMFKLCRFVHFLAMNLTPLSLILLQDASERTLSRRQFLAIDLIPLSLISPQFSTFSSFRRGQFLAIRVSPRFVTLSLPDMFNFCKRWQKRATWPMALSVIDSHWSPEKSMLCIPIAYDVTALTVSSVTLWELQNEKSTSRQNNESLQRLFQRLQVYEAWNLCRNDKYENIWSHMLSGRSQWISEDTSLWSSSEIILLPRLHIKAVSCGFNL